MCILPWNSTEGRVDDLESSEHATEEHLLNTGTEKEEKGDTQIHSKCLRIVFSRITHLVFFHSEEAKSNIQ